MDKKLAFLSVLCITTALLFAVLSLNNTAAMMSNREERLGEMVSRSPVQMTPQLSGALPFTYYVYLPVISRNPLPITETLKSKYLFVERWSRVESSEQCSSAGLASIPVYSFSPQSGVLTVYPASAQFKLTPDDIGYIGCGVSGDWHYANYLYRFHDIPFSACGLTLNAVNDDGIVSLEYAGEVIRLEPRTEWISSTVSQKPEMPACVITTTHRISNRAFQDRDKIEYRRGLTLYGTP